jgi:8-amino-7-oxononanoate synthase
MQHASRELGPWSQLTRGVPAAILPPPGAESVGQQLAGLIGCERGTLAPSTLHLFWDLFGTLAGQVGTIYLDDGVYPIARWGVERAAARGAHVRSFPHHNAMALRRLALRDAPHLRPPLVVTDGYCPNCGRVAPLAMYREAIRDFGGRLILDDTQALGILGRDPGPGAPYGSGGGGSLRWSGIAGPDLLVIASLAKGFGTPVALLAGSEAAIRQFEQQSDTRIHCSPPSVAVIHAAARALALNRNHGDALRARLARLVARLRERLAEAGLTTTGELFPVQTLMAGQYEPIKLYAALRARGILTVLRRGHPSKQAQLSFITTALHRSADIDRLALGLTRAAVQLEVPAWR